MAARGRRCGQALVLSTVLWACAGAPPEPSDGPPLTDRDPPPYTPGPSDEPHTGSAVGLTTAGGYDQARAVALRVIQAVRDGDEATLTQLLGVELTQLFPRLSETRRERDALVANVLATLPQIGLGPEVPVDQLIDPEHLEVRPLARVYQDQPLPSGMQGTDLMVTFPLMPRGQQVFPPLLGWRQNQGGVVVRPGAQPHVVAI